MCLARRPIWRRTTPDRATTCATIPHSFLRNTGTPFKTPVPKLPVVTRTPFFSVYKPPPPAPVKYSEIVESAPGNHQRLEHFAQVITKHKDKEYLGLCPPPMKPQYAEPAKAPYADQYLHKEPQMKAYNMPAAMQMQRDQYPQYLPKYNAQAQYPSHQYNHQEPNTFLAQLSQLNPRLAHSIMNEHRIREQVGSCPRFFLQCFPKVGKIDI